MRRNPFPKLSFSVSRLQEPYLNDSICNYKFEFPQFKSWSQLGDHATNQNCPQLLAQPPTVDPAPCDTWHHSFHSDGNSSSFHPDGKFLIPPERESLIPLGRESLIPPRRESLIPPERESLIPLGYLSFGAPCRRIEEEDDSTSPGKHVRILR